MRILSLGAALAGFLAIAAPHVASAMDGGCSHECSAKHTIASLAKCVTHARSMDHIADDSIKERLLRKLNHAAAAAAEGDNELAINLLDAFINQVAAQAGKKIVDKCANHLIAHAVDVINSLEEQ